MAKKGQRQHFMLVCSECGEHNYVSEKNVTATKEKLEIMKFCPRDRKHTLHKEEKIRVKPKG
jgi:large subunit ribosomal protein L33